MKTFGNYITKSQTRGIIAMNIVLEAEPWTFLNPESLVIPSLTPKALTSVVWKNSLQFHN